MSVTITLDTTVASQLQALASQERLSAEELAGNLLAEALQRHALSTNWDAANRRRVELIRNSSRDGLSGEEAAELAGLQAQLDQRLEHWDKELLAQLERMEKAAEDLPGDGN